MPESLDQPLASTAPDDRARASASVGHHLGDQVPDRDDRERELGPIVIALLRGVIYRTSDENRWLRMLRLQNQVRDHLRVLGLEVFIDDAEGYAFLRSADTDADDPDPLPRLVPRRPLTYGVSLLLALLRRRLAEHDATSGADRLVMTRSEIANLVEVFQASSTDEAKLAQRVESDVSKIVDLGFLRPLTTRVKRGEEPTYEVRRILKAFVDAQWLTDFDARLAEYRSSRLDMTQRNSGSSRDSDDPETASDDD